MITSAWNALQTLTTYIHLSSNRIVFAIYSAGRKAEPHHTPYTNIHLKWIKTDINEKGKTIKLYLKENKRYYLKDLGESKILQEDTKSSIHKKRDILDKISLNLRTSVYLKKKRHLECKSKP